jgi:chromosome segregation ATPase
MDLDKETMKRKTLSVNEENLLKQYHHLEENYEKIQKEYQNYRSSIEKKYQCIVEEKDVLLSSYSQQISTLQQEKLQTIEYYQEELQAKLRETNSYYEKLLETMKEKEKEIVEEERRNYYYDQLLLLQNQHQEETLSAINHEKEKSLIELNKLRSYYEERESSISKDILSLEKLHQQRLENYENTIQQLKLSIESLQEYLSTLSLSYEKKLSENHLIIQQLTTELQNQLLLLNSYKNEYQLLQEKDTSIQSNEKVYRGKLIEVMNEMKIIKSEKQELLSQVSSMNQENALKTSQLNDILTSITSQEQNMRIQKEEISLLESDLQRVIDDNSYLKNELLRYERLIYGVSQQQHQHQTSLQSNLANTLASSSTGRNLFSDQIQSKNGETSLHNSFTSSSGLPVPPSPSRFLNESHSFGDAKHQRSHHNYSNHHVSFRSASPSPSTTSYSSTSVSPATHARPSLSTAQKSPGKSSSSLLPPRPPSSYSATSLSNKFPNHHYQKKNHQDGIKETRKSFPFVKSLKCEYCLRPHGNNSKTSVPASSHSHHPTSSDNSSFICYFCHKRNMLKT